MCAGRITRMVRPFCLSNPCASRGANWIQPYDSQRLALSTHSTCRRDRGGAADRHRLGAADVSAGGQRHPDLQLVRSVLEPGDRDPAQRVQFASARHERHDQLPHQRRSDRLHTCGPVRAGLWQSWQYEQPERLQRGRTEREQQRRCHPVVQRPLLHQRQSLRHIGADARRRRCLIQRRRERRRRRQCRHHLGRHVEQHRVGGHDAVGCGHDAGRRRAGGPERGWRGRRHR